MNCSINCPQARQRCPSPWQCGEGCHFNNEVVPKQSAQERAAAKFWEPDLPVQFVGPEPEVEKPSIAATLFLWACGLVAFCLVVSLMVPKK
jgi:hypothetical protein